MARRKKALPGTVFDRIDREKQDKIIHAAIEEFAERGFELASTNRMAKKAGVAKGSLFKYFGSKENIYYAVANHVLEEYLAHLRGAIPRLPSDLLERFMIMQDRIYDFFGASPKMFMLFKRILTERGGAIHLKIREKWQPITGPIFQEFLDGADLSRLRISAQELMQVIEWIDTAVDMDVMASMSPDATVEDVKNMYRKKIGLAYSVMKDGIYK